MSEARKPDVSVVIPCYNAEKWVSRAIESVLAQEGVSVEVLVVDDGSTDKSLEVLRACSGRIIWETGPNRGACPTRNQGLAMARADYVMFLDADDYLERGTLLGLYTSLNQNNADIAFCHVASADVKGTYIYRQLPRLEPTTSFIADWISGSFVPPCGILWASAFLRKIGSWNERLEKNQDGELVLRAVLSGATMTISTTGRAIYWIHDGPDRISNTVTKAKLDDSFQVLCSVRDALSNQIHVSPELKTAFSQATHSLQRLSLRHGLDEMAEEIRLYRQAEGWPPTEGTRAHRTASSLLGLARKERLSKWLVQLKAQGFRFGPNVAMKDDRR